MPPVQNKSLEQFENLQQISGGGELAKEIGKEIGNTLQAFKELPKEEKRVLVGGAIMLLGIATLLKPEKQEKKDVPKTKKELAVLQKSIDKQKEEAKDHTEGYEDLKDKDENEGGYEEKPLLSEEEITEARLESLTPYERTALAAELAVTKYKTEGRNCWDWVDNVYLAAGCERKQVFSYVGKDYEKYHATDEQLKNMKIGSHMIYHNGNDADKNGFHSVMFMGWADFDKKVAKVASYYAAKNRSNFFKVDLNRRPVMRVFEPVSKNPVNLAYLNVRQMERKEKGIEVT